MDIIAVQHQLRAGAQIPEYLIEVFTEETDEQIRSIYDGLDRLRLELGDLDALADVRRSSHTLKGAAGAAGHEPIMRLSHRMEDLLDFLFDNKHPLSNHQLQLLLVATDHIQDLARGEFVFDEMATSLLGLYHQFDQQFASTLSMEQSTELSIALADTKSIVQSMAREEPKCSVFDQLFGADFEDESVLANSHVQVSEIVTNVNFENVNIEKPHPEVANASVVQTPSLAQDSLQGDTVDPKHLALVLEQLNASIVIQPEIQAIFSEEAQELLHAVYQGLERLKQNRDDRLALSEVRRSAHTLKGAAGAVGTHGITRLAHRMEDLLDVLAERNDAVTESQLQIMLITADRLQDLINGQFDIADVAQSMGWLYTRYDHEMQAYHAVNVEVDPANVVADTKESFETVEDSNVEAKRTLGSDGETAEQDSGAAEKASKPEAKSAEGKLTSRSGQYLRVPLERIDGLVALVGEMVVNRSAMNQRLSDFDSRIQDMQLVINRFRAVAHDIEQSFGVEAMQQSAKSRQSTSRKASPSISGMVPVNRIAAFTNPEHANKFNNSTHANLDVLEFDRYNQLHLLARSIAEATSDIAVIANEFRSVYGDIDSLIERQQRHNRDAQNGLMQIRMLPISSIVLRLERTVRTVSNKLGKNVDFTVIGDNTELDKTVLEEITDPLLHLIRNALDHGIESSEQRAADGKPTRASLTLESLNQGTQVTLRVSDDGRGLDLAKIRKKAVELGIIQEHTVLSNEELHDLIFVPGFSTSESLTDISGRGVGMDVVRDAVQRLKGTIRVESNPGKGATFTIHLPTSLSVTRALVVVSNSHTFAIPMQSVEQIVRLDMVNTTRVGLQMFVNRDGKLVLLKDLAQHLEMRSETNTEDAVASKPVLLIRSGDNEVAIMVDIVKGGQDIVVKTLGDHLHFVPGYLGATLAGDGTVIPILDASELCGEKVEKRSSQFIKSHETKTKRRRTVMVVDDSLSVRRVASNLLRSHGWDVIDAKDGLDALEKLGTHDTPPDIFLCDMEMPRMDGLELIERLRGMSEFKTTPIVMVTSRSGEKHRRLASEAGANEHVVKPFKDDQLIALIERMVTEHRELVGV